MNKYNVYLYAIIFYAIMFFKNIFWKHIIPSGYVGLVVDEKPFLICSRIC